MGQALRDLSAEALARHLDELRDDPAKQLGAAFALLAAAEDAAGAYSPLGHEITMRQQERIAVWGARAFPLSFRQCELLAEIAAQTRKI